MFEVHISKHSPLRLEITVGCQRCCGVLCVHEGVVLCVVLCVVCVCGVLCWCWCWCLVVVLCCVVLCCVVWCGVMCMCVCVFLCCFFSFFSQFFFLFLALSLFLSSLFFPLFSLLSSLPLCLLSSLLATKHYGKNRSTNTAANIEAFECDLAQGKCTAVGSLPPPLPSLVPSPPHLLKKRGGNFLLQEYFRRGNYFYYSFKLIQKNRRRVKLQTLQFLFEFENNRTATRQNCNNFGQDGILFHRIPFLFGTWANKSNTKLLCKYGDDFSICQRCSFIVFRSTGNVVEHRHK